MRKLLLLSLLALPLAAGPLPGGSCVSGSLQDYIDLGTSGCYGPDGLLVHSFAYTPTYTISATDVTVTYTNPGGDWWRNYFVFSGPWIAAPGQFLVFSIQWEWEATDWPH